jgi:hypothetical protein
VLVGSFHHVAPTPAATATTPAIATSRSFPTMASTSGTSSTLPVMLSVEPGIAMSTTTIASCRARAIASRGFETVAEGIPGRC